MLLFWPELSVEVEPWEEVNSSEGGFGHLHQIFCIKHLQNWWQLGHSEAPGECQGSILQSRREGGSGPFFLCCGPFTLTALGLSSVTEVFLTSMALTLLTRRHDGCDPGQQTRVWANRQVSWAP